jgi:uncharacterized iron-regulated membrane protein
LRLHIEASPSPANNRFIWRILISAMGEVVAMLSATGVLIWWRKRASRKKAAATQGNALQAAF